MSVLNRLIDAPRIAITLLAPTLAAAMLAIASMGMGSHVMTFMNVQK